MAFDPKRHVIRVQGGREYLPVSARLVWFRGDHPDWGIVTEPMEINQEKQYALFRASIFNEEGRLIATATKREDVRGFPDYIEKSETGAVGRALALCGYGTQFAPELEEAGRFGDGARGGMRPANTMSRAPMAPPRPMERQAPPMERQAPPGERPERPVPPPERAERSAPRDEPPPPIEDEAPFAARPAPSAPRPAPRENEPELPPLRPASSLPRPPARPAPRGEAPAPRPAPAGAPIQRVREPERENLDPGGPDDDFDDPFADLEEAPAASSARPANRTTAPARNAVRRPARAEAPESLL